MDLQMVVRQDGQMAELETCPAELPRHTLVLVEQINAYKNVRLVGTEVIHQMNRMQQQVQTLVSRNGTSARKAHDPVGSSGRRPKYR